MMSNTDAEKWASIRNLNPKDLLSSSIPFTDTKDKITNITPEVIKANSEPETEEEDTSEIVVHSPAPTPRKRNRGRPKKTESIASTEDVVAGPVARSRGRKAVSADADAAYRPVDTGYEAEGDEEAVDDDWEAAALAWGLVAASGLGGGSSAVFGAECVAR